MTSREAPAGAGPEVVVVIEDLAFVEAEALARPVTATMGATTALLRRLELAAGPALDALQRTEEPLAVGAAVVTGAGALKAELLIHAVISSRDERATADTVRRAALSALQRAEAFGVVHLAMPPFGLGAGNLDPEGSAAAMGEALRAHARSARLPERVTIVVETDDERQAFSGLAARVRA